MKLLRLGLVCAAGLFAQSASSTASGVPPKEWPPAVDDRMRNTFVLTDILEYRPRGKDSDFRWDMEGWHGGDINKLWFKSEGERNTALKADYDIDGQLLYGRFLRKYYDFQVGVRGETQTFQGRNVTRAHAVIGVEGLVPYNYEVETAMFISQNGDVSGRLTFTKDLLLSQRWIVQSRFETTLAAQRVERFTTGRGLNNIEFGFRVRYEFSRKFAPYAGVSFDRSFFGTAAMVRAEGGDPRQIRFVLGVRMWH